MIEPVFYKVQALLQSLKRLAQSFLRNKKRKTMICQSGHTGRVAAFFKTNKIIIQWEHHAEVLL
jgi:hypothetical protein